MAELLQYTQEWHQQQQDIHPSDYIEETAEHNEIAELSSSLLALFKEVVLVLSRQTGIPRDARISIERSCSALILWSDGFGITQGRLNDTFNKSRKLRYTALKNLVHIGRVLIERLVPAVDISSEKLQALCSSAELNIEAAAGLVTEESCRQSDDSSSDAASNFSDDDIYEIAEDLKTDTLVLSGLDPLLKYPIFDAQHEHIIESYALSTWGPEKSYSDKIGNRFPRADVSLTLYLGRANYERFLRCQEAREYQEEEEPLPMVNQEAGTHAGTIIANTKFHDSGVGTSIGLTMSYAETTMSYNHDGQSVRIPPLPKEAKAGSPFTCIACGRTVIITNNSAWKQHIYLDLQPYMCLDLSCPYSSSTFESRDKWISHLALDHEMEPKWASAECPLCREETGNGKIAITKHLSKHLEEVSLSALPVEVDSDAESENSPESSDAGSSLNEGVFGGAFGGIDENGETLSVEFETELASKVFSNLVDKLKAERNHNAQSEAKGGALQKAADILAASEAENMAAQLKRTQENIEEMFRKKEGTSKMAKLLSPIKFTDAVGRRFNFPVHLCYTWQEMEDLIKQAFSQVDILGPHVQAGHYDLTGPDGKIILSSVWEETVEPGLHITMTMWPLDKAPLEGLDPKETEQPRDEGGNRDKDNISSKQQQGAQHSENVQGARIIRMSGQNFFSTAKAYFKDQPDKFTRFRVILADIATTEWVPEAWRRSCFECRMVEAKCDAKAPDPCTRCRLKKLSCAVQFAAVSRQHTIVNGDQIRQGIINIGRLCEGYPSFMHELNSVMPTGYRVELLDASTVRYFTPDNESTILQVGMSRDSTTDLGNQSGLDVGPNQQGNSMSGAPSSSTLAKQDSPKAAIKQQDETSHYFVQPEEPNWTSTHLVVDTKNTLELTKATRSLVEKIKQRFIGSPHMSMQLLEILQDTQNSIRSTETVYMVAQELLGQDPNLMDEFQLLTGKGGLKLEDVMQRVQGVSKDNTEAPGEPSKQDHDAIVKLLLDKEADIDVKYNTEAPGEPSKQDHEAIVKLLLDKGADIDVKDNSAGQTLLSMAAKHGHEALVKLLLERADLKTPAQTPLLFAAKYGSEELVKLLVEKADTEMGGVTFSQASPTLATKEGHDAPIIKGDEAQMQDPDSSNHSLLYHQLFPTSRTNPSLQNDQQNYQASEGADDQDMLEGETTVEDYLRIHRRANGDFQEILRIIEEEGLQEKLEYWVEVTRRSIGTIADHNRAGKAASEPIAKVGATVGKKSSLNDPNEPKYCLCNKGSVGIMIRCDNVDSCKYKWFHLECVGLTVAPSSKDKWYCTDCRGDVNIGKKANIDPQALPPDSGNPEFVMDTEVSTGEGSADILFGTQANLAYLEGLAKFHKQQGNNLDRLPYVDKKPVDLYRLRNLVESRGGFDKVCKSKEWAEIAKDLGYSGRIMSSLSTSLKNTFLRWLSPYEEYLCAAKPGVEHQLEQEHVDPRNKGKIPSIGRINYASPNPDIYIWPSDSNVSGEDESEPARPPTAPPPLPPPVMEATDPFTDRVKSSTDPELSSPFSDKRGLFDGEYPGHEPFLARPRPDIYTKQLPPISGVSDGGDSAGGGNSENFVLSPNPFLRAFGPGDVTLPCEAEPPERRLCFQRFVDNESRDRHYLSSHREFAKEQGIQYLARACTICDAKFHRRDNLKRHIEDHHSIHKEHGAAGLELTDLDNEDFANVGTDTVNDVAAGGRSSRDERDRGFFNTKIGAQVAQESDMQDRNISPNDEYMQAQAQARAHGRGQSLANYNDDFTIKVSGRAVVKIPGTQIEYDGGEITISTNSEAGARPGSGMPGASRAVNDKESTAYQAQAQVQAQAQHQAQEPQQAHSNATLRVQMQAHASLVYNRLMEVAADQFSGPENVPQETVDKIKQESYAQTQRLAKDLVQQRAQQQQQREQKAAMQAMDGIEVARSEKEGSIQGNKGATQLKDVSSPPLESLAPVIGSMLNRPHNDISSLKIEQEKAEDDLDPFAEYFDELEDEILEDENKMQERERRWVDIIKLWENNEPPFHLKS